MAQLTYDSYAASYASLFTSPPCLMHSSLHSSPCNAWLCPLLFSSILPPPCGCIMPFCCHILSLCWDSSVDLTQTCTYSSSSIKGHKCQLENSSLVLLVFPLHSQRDHLQNQLLALLVCPLPSLRFPGVLVDTVTFWVVSLELNYYSYSTESLTSTCKHKLACSQVLTWCTACSDVCQCPTPSIGCSAHSPPLTRFAPLKTPSTTLTWQQSQQEVLPSWLSREA